jgi:hypothetical protein
MNKVLIILAFLTADTAFFPRQDPVSLMRANEASAIAALRMTIVAQAAYAKTCGKGKYASGYRVLGFKTKESFPFISADFASAAEPIRNGYVLRIEPTAAGSKDRDCNGKPTMSQYRATAEPISFGKTGELSFAVDEVREIWQSASAKAPREPFASTARKIGSSGR